MSFVPIPEDGGEEHLFRPCYFMRTACPQTLETHPIHSLSVHFSLSLSPPCGGGVVDYFNFLI